MKSNGLTIFALFALFSCSLMIHDVGLAAPRGSNRSAEIDQKRTPQVDQERSQRKDGNRQQPREGENDQQRDADRSPPRDRDRNPPRDGGERHRQDQIIGTWNVKWYQERGRDIEGIVVFNVDGSIGGTTNWGGGRWAKVGRGYTISHGGRTRSIHIENGNHFGGERLGVEGRKVERRTRN